MQTVVSWVEKVGRTGSCNFPTNSCKFPTEDIMDAQNFNFAPKFPQHGGISVTKFCILDENFLTKIIFSNNFLTAQNLGWIAPLLCPSQPRRH